MHRCTMSLGGREIHGVPLGLLKPNRMAALKPNRMAALQLFVYLFGPKLVLVV